MSQAASSEIIITGFIGAIRPSFDYVVVLTTLSSCLLTLLVVLFAFSTKESRRRLVFHLNVLAICLTLILGIFSGITSGQAVLDPFHLVSKNVYIATIVFAVFPPLFYDSILLFRLFALYPPAITPKITLLKIFAFPFCIKCARIVVIVRFLHNILPLFPPKHCYLVACSQPLRPICDEHGGSCPKCNGHLVPQPLFDRRMVNANS